MIFRRGIVIAGLIVAAHYALGQNTLDSLEQILKGDLADTVRVQALNRLAHLYWQKDPNRMEELAKESLQLAQTIGYESGEAKAFENLATAYELRGDIIPSIENHYKAIRIHSRLQNQEQLAISYANLAISYYKTDNYELALEYMHNALEYSLALKDTSMIISNLTFIGSIYSDLNDPEQAITELRKVAQMENTNAKGEVSGYTFYNIAQAFFKLDNYDSATLYYNKAVDYAHRYQDSYMAQIAFLAQARIHYLNSDVTKFLHYLNRAEEIIDINHYSDSKHDWLDLKIAFALDRSDLDEAWKLAHEGLKLSKQNQSNFSIARYCNHLSNVFLAKGDMDSAYHYLLEMVKQENRAQEERNFQKVATWNFNFRMDQQLKDQEALRLKLMTEEKKRIDRDRLLIISTLVIFFVSIVGVILVRLYTQKKTLSEKLITANAELTTSVLTVQQLNQEMRAMTNSIIHDLRSPFVSLEYLLKYFREHASLSSNDRMLLNIGLNETKKGQAFVSQLLNNKLSQGNLKEASPYDLNDLARELELHFRQQAKAKHISLDIQASNAQVQISRQRLFRVLDNLISNALKFSEERSTIWVSLSIEQSSLVMMVRDQGPGFTEEDKQKVFKTFERLSATATGGEASHGVGLLSVKLLVDQLGGSINLKSAPGEGAEFTVTIPLPASASVCCISFATSPVQPV